MAIRVKGLAGAGLAYGLEDGPTPIPTRLEAALDELEKDTTIRGLRARS